jgi:hypothetical protein
MTLITTTNNNRGKERWNDKNRRPDKEWNFTGGKI